MENNKNGNGKNVKKLAIIAAIIVAVAVALHFAGPSIVNYIMEMHGLK